MCPLETPPGGDREQTDEWVEEMTGGGRPNTHSCIPAGRYDGRTPLSLTLPTDWYQSGRGLGKPSGLLV